jgi:Flp pilus assembly protein TadG
MMMLRFFTSSARSKRDRQRGGAVIEFAVALPLIAFVLFGLLDAGRAMLTYHTLTHASETAVRFASVRSKTSEAPATTGAIETRVMQTSSGLEAEKLDVNTEWTPSNIRGGTVRVRITYPFTPITPFVPWETITLLGSAESRITN